MCAECGDGQKTEVDQDIFEDERYISAIAHLTLIFLGGNTPGALQVHQSIEKKNAEGLLFFFALAHSSSIIQTSLRLPSRTARAIIIT